MFEQQAVSMEMISVPQSSDDDGDEVGHGDGNDDSEELEDEFWFMNDWIEWTNFVMIRRISRVCCTIH